jgi:IclR family acetate operon transcriptional repressor
MVCSGYEAVSVEQIPSPRQVEHTSPIGTPASSSVQVFLAHLSGAELRVLLERGLPQYSNRTQADIDRYLARLAEVRQRGYAINDGETHLEEVGIAAPIHDHRDEPVAAVLLSAPRFRLARTALPGYGEAVLQTAHEITARLGGRPRTIDR